MTKNIQKIKYEIIEIRTQGIWVQSPPRFPLRYGGQRNSPIKIINIC